MKRVVCSLAEKISFVSVLIGLKNFRICLFQYFVNHWLAV